MLGTEEASEMVNSSEQRWLLLRGQGSCFELGDGEFFLALFKTLLADVCFSFDFAPLGRAGIPSWPPGSSSSALQ